MGTSKRYRMMVIACVDVTSAQALRMEKLKSNEEANALAEEVLAAPVQLRAYNLDAEPQEVPEGPVSNEELETLVEITDFGMVSKAASRVVLDVAQESAKLPESKIITLDSVTKH